MKFQNILPISKTALLLLALMSVSVVHASEVTGILNSANVSNTNTTGQISGEVVSGGGSETTGTIGGTLATGVVSGTVSGGSSGGGHIGGGSIQSSTIDSATSNAPLTPNVSTYNPFVGAPQALTNNTAGALAVADGTEVLPTEDATTSTDTPALEAANTNQLAAAGVFGDMLGSWYWWLLIIILIVLAYYLYRRNDKNKNNY